jgi:ATP-dependent exoDNAse (exonuclease V) beta subunit
MDMKLLYVACTRALHELTISYRNNLVLPFKESCINENQLTLKK